MGTVDDYPSGNANDEIGRRAEDAFSRAIESHGGFRIQKRDRFDSGTDFQIEACINTNPTNLRVHIQVKGTKGPALSDGSVSVSIARTNLNYLLTPAESIYICLHIPTNRLLIRHAQDVYRQYEKHGENWYEQETLTVRFSEELSTGVLDDLHARVLDIGRASRDSRLAWQKIAPPEQGGKTSKLPLAPIYVPTDPEHASQLLKSLFDRGEDAIISRAFNQFRIVLSAFPDAMALAYMAEINLGVNGAPFDRDRVRHGVRALEETMARGRHWPGTIRYSIGNAWLALQEYEHAAEEFCTALEELKPPEMNSTAAQCWKNLGSTLEHLGQHDEARLAFEKALGLDPDLGEAHLALALWHRKHDDNLRKALEHLELVVSRPGSAMRLDTVHGWRAELLFRIGNTVEAYREVQNLSQYDGELDWVLPWCAQLVVNYGSDLQYARTARVFWKRYLEHHPAHSAAQKNYLQALWAGRRNDRLNDQEQAEYVRVAKSLSVAGDEDAAPFWDRLGHSLEDSNDTPAAEEAFRNAAQLDPAEFSYCLGTFLNRRKQHVEALTILVPLADTHRHAASVWCEIAIAEAGLGNIDDAVNAYTYAIEAEEDFAQAWFGLGGLFWNHGAFAEAGTVWHEAVRRFPSHALATNLVRDIPIWREWSRQPNDS